MTPAGNKYLITVTDYYTKWPVAGALKDKSASSVAEFLYMVQGFCTFSFCVSAAVLYYILSRCSVLTVARL